MTIVAFISVSAAFGEVIDSLVRGMSPEEKAGQMILVYYSPFDFLEKHQVGGVLIMQHMLKKPEVLRQELHHAQTRLPIPLLVTIDQEGGSVNRLSALPGYKNLPSAANISGWSPDSIEGHAVRMAEKLAWLGININLAPVLDPTVNAQNQITFMGIKKRSFGDGVDQIAPAAGAFIRGFSRHGVRCIAKHFPGYDVTTNSDLEISYSQADSQAISGYAGVFRAMDSLIDGVMMNSIRYHQADDIPAVLSSQMVSRARNGNDDLIVMTDDLYGESLRRFMLGDSLKNYRKVYPDSVFAALVERAVLAGNDMLMITFPQKVPIMLDVITSLAANDPAIANQVDKAVCRILKVKAKLGLFDVLSEVGE